MNSIPDDQDDLSNQDDEYDDSEENEDEEIYPQSNSDPEEQATILKNGRQVDSSNSSPAKESNGDSSKIEKFAKEAK